MDLEGRGSQFDTALVLRSLPALASPSALRGTSSQRLDDDVLLQFDATHHLSEFTTAWGAVSTYFCEKLQVRFFGVLSLDVRSSFSSYAFSLSLSLSLSLFSLFLGIIPASFSRLKPRKSCLLR